MRKFDQFNLSTALLPQILGLVTCTGLAGGLWLTQAAIAPSAAQAYTARVDVTLDRRAGENYETLLRRSEAAARAAAQRGFDRDILATQVSVIVSAQSNGAVVPVMTLDVSRNQWRSRPDPQRWATYFRSSQALLQLQRLPGAEVETQQAPPPPPTVPSQPSNLPPIPGTQIPTGIGVPSQAAPGTNGGVAPGAGTGTGTTPAGTRSGAGATGTGAGTQSGAGATDTGAGTRSGSGATGTGAGTGTQSQPVLTTPSGETITPTTQPAGTTPTGTQPQPLNVPATSPGTTPTGATQSSPTITTPGGQTITVPTPQPGTTNNVPSNALPSTTIR